MNDISFTENEAIVDEAARYMKLLSHPRRLMVMCKITRKPHCVSELMALTNMSQTALSHQLAKLREENMVKTKRKGKEIYYSIADPQFADLVEHICRRFQC